MYIRRIHNKPWKSSVKSLSEWLKYVQVGHCLLNRNQPYNQPPSVVQNIIHLGVDSNSLIAINDMNKTKSGCAVVTKDDRVVGMLGILPLSLLSLSLSIYIYIYKYV